MLSVERLIQISDEARNSKDERLAKIFYALAKLRAHDKEELIALTLHRLNDLVGMK